MKLKDLAIEHPYYCSESNYYSNEAATKYNSMSDFIDDFKDADIDMNLVFRWDVHQNRDYDTDELINGYYAEVFMMHQRKGIFHPIYISEITEEEVQPFIEYLKPHLECLMKLWQPLTLSTK